MNSNLMIILDGVQDIAYPELGGKTPLEAGGGEAVGAIERAAAGAYLRTTPEGFEPDTQVCMLSLLGVRADAMPSGRSSLEAAALDMPVGAQDLVLRCNFIKLAPDGALDVPCCEAEDDLARKLMDEVAAEYGASLTRIGPYKCLQTVAGERDSIAGIKTFPPHNYQGSALEEILPAGNELAERLAATTRRLYEQYRPFTVFHWAPSVAETLPRFAALHGFAGAVVTKTLVLEGIARLMDMPCPDLPTATGDTDTDLAAKVAATLELAEKHPFVALHVGGTDEATHRQDPVEKARFVARVDRELLAPVLAAVPEGTRIMLTCDHEAYCSTAGHTTEPVRALLYRKGRVCGGDLGYIDAPDAVALLCRGDWDA